MTDLKYGVVWLPEAGVVLAIGGIPGAPAGDVTGPGVLDTVMLGLLTANSPSTTRLLLLKVELKSKFPFEFGKCTLPENFSLSQTPSGETPKIRLNVSVLICCGKISYSISPLLTFTGRSTKASSSSDMPIDAGLQADQVAIIETSSAFPRVWRGNAGNR